MGASPGETLKIIKAQTVHKKSAKKLPEPSIKSGQINKHSTSNIQRRILNKVI